MSETTELKDRQIWDDPTPVLNVSEHLATIQRLNEASARQYRDSEASVDWTHEPSDRFFKTEDSLALCGTPYWEHLDEADRKRLARLEVLHTWDSFRSIETFAAHFMANIVLREYTKKAQGIPEEIQVYWIHFSKEELVHTLMFRRALRHFGAPLFPDESWKARIMFGGLNWVSVATLATAVEWFQEELQWKTSTQPEIDPVARRIMISHHIEEARHVRFGREVVAGFWRSQPEEEREKAIPLIVAAIRTLIDDLGAHEDVLRAMEFTHPEMQDVRKLSQLANGCEYRVELNKKIYARLFSFFRDVEVFNRKTAPIFAKGGIDHYFTGL